ncbi:MAG: hypothetical protein F4X99_07695 [Gammaproteobacteria bacterium]|nr:hypothetical protein [Gammaproteobacteria bacterium]
MHSRRTHAVIVGGSIAALGATLALSRAGFRVTCIERDRAAMPADHLAAWDAWRRTGAGQTRHSHILLAPLNNLIKAHAPEFHALLIASGAEELRFADVARSTFENPELVAEDGDITFLACRRVVFEYLLRRYMLEQGGFEYMHGARVRGLETGDGRAAGVRVRSADGEHTLDADVVVDASGLHTRADHWFEEAGLDAVHTERQPCGIFYTSRFYRLRDGADYPTLDGRQSLAGGVQGIDLGYLKAGLFRSDNRTFSLTLAADPEDAPMAPIGGEAGFDAAANAIEVSADWVSAERSEPISRVFLYGNLQNTRRHYLVDGRPALRNFFAIGDAHVHTNPISGRGCALAWVSAFALADTLAEHRDADDRAGAFEAAIERDVVPWYDVQVQQDRQSLAVNKALQRGEDPFDFHNADGTVDERKRRGVVFRKGLGHAARSDIEVMRALFRQVNLLDSPGSFLERSDLLGKVIAGYEASRDEDLKRRPYRDEMLALFEAAGASA